MAYFNKIKIEREPGNARINDPSIRARMTQHGIYGKHHPRGFTARRGLRKVYVRTDGKPTSKTAVKLLASTRHWLSADRRFRRFEERTWKDAR